MARTLSSRRPTAARQQREVKRHPAGRLACRSLPHPDRGCSDEAMKGFLFLAAIKAIVDNAK